MGDFFHGWRRKVGLLTLVMAYVAMGGCVRSSFKDDFFEIVASKAKYGDSSMKGLIVFFYYHAERSRVKERRSRFGSSELQVSYAEDQLIGKQLNVILGEFYLQSGDDIWGFFSDRVQTHGPDVPVYRVEVQVPYWFLVIPLTLLSAYLLLAKSRKSPSMKIAEPVSSEGT